MTTKKAFKNGNSWSPQRYDDCNSDIQAKGLTEWKIGVSGLVLCLAVLTAKLYCAYGNDIRELVFEKRMITYETLTTEGERMVMHGWKTAAKYSSIWFPALCGFLTAYFTGLIVYLDSSVPGVQPPSPFSPTKYKVRSGHTFHSNYSLAIIIGLCVTTYMYWKGISLQF